MDLPVMPPVSPMLAKLSRTLPLEPGLSYEPKWDGFRALVYRDGDEIEVRSRGEKSLTEYFPELVPAFRTHLPQRCVVDGEIVVAGRKGLDFHLLQQRIHPAASRVQRLAVEIPASFIAFDLLAIDDRDLRHEPFSLRRATLERALEHATPPVHLTPTTHDPEVATGWLERFVGAGLDGVVVKDPDLTYQEGRRVMVKVKHERTAECVVAGYRLHKDGRGVGSLLLGLYDGRGNLHHVGVASAFTEAQRRAFLDEVGPLEMADVGAHPWAAWRDAAAHERLLMPGTPSRWSGAREKEVDWVPLRPERVAEVRYEHLLGPRFRHPARFVRWRPDRDAASCTYAQLLADVPDELGDFLAATSPGT